MDSPRVLDDLEEEAKGICMSDDDQDRQTSQHPSVGATEGGQNLFIVQNTTTSSEVDENSISQCVKYDISASEETSINEVIEMACSIQDT